MTLVIKTTKEHGFLDKLCNVMSNDDFRNFFHQYLKDWDDVKTSIMFMKLYSCVDEEYSRRNGGMKLEPDKIVEIIKEMISDKDCRKVIMGEMDDFMRGRISRSPLKPLWTVGSHELLINEGDPSGSEHNNLFTDCHQTSI